MDSESLIQFSKELGFIDVALTKLEIPKSHEAHYRKLLEEQSFGEMDYLKRNIEKRLLKEKDFSHALVFLFPYRDHTSESNLGDFKIARYAHGDDYHHHLKNKLHLIEDLLRKEIPGIQTKSYVDTAPIPERSLAFQAGLGWIGKNTMLISKTFGSYTLISTILLDQPIPVKARNAYPLSFCGSCTRCIEACPSQAITKDQGILPHRCISYINNESRSVDHLHGWLIGCDICQEVCPWNGKASSFIEKREAWLEDPELQSKFQLFKNKQISFRKAFKTKAFFRVGSERLQKLLSMVLQENDKPPEDNSKKKE